MLYFLILLNTYLVIQVGDPTNVFQMFPEEDLEMFGAFSLVITALLWFLGYVILQVRSYKRLYLQEVKYNKTLSEAEAERSRIALETMEAVRQTMEKQMENTRKDRQTFLEKIDDLDSGSESNSGDPSNTTSGEEQGNEN